MTPKCCLTFTSQRSNRAEMLNTIGDSRFQLQAWTFLLLGAFYYFFRSQSTKCPVWHFSSFCFPCSSSSPTMGISLLLNRFATLQRLWVGQSELQNKRNVAVEGQKVRTPIVAKGEKRLTCSQGVCQEFDSSRAALLKDKCLHPGEKRPSSALSGQSGNCRQTGLRHLLEQPRGWQGKMSGPGTE